MFLTPPSGKPLKARFVEIKGAHYCLEASPEKIRQKQAKRQSGRLRKDELAAKPNPQTE